MSDQKPIITKEGIELIPVENNFSDDQINQMREHMDIYGSIMIQEQIMKNIVPNIQDMPLHNPNEKLESLTEDEILQTKQLNDKISSQNFYIKQSQADLKEEFNNRAVAEKKLSSKDWKLVLLALISALTTLAIEHWKDIYNFILSLIE